MKRLALSNYYAAELGIFKYVFSDPAIAFPDDKTLFSQKLANVLLNSLFIDILIVVEFQNFKKKSQKLNKFQKTYYCKKI